MGNTLKTNCEYTVNVKVHVVLRCYILSRFCFSSVVLTSHLSSNIWKIEGFHSSSINYMNLNMSQVVLNKLLFRLKVCFCMKRFEPKNYVFLLLYILI